MPKKLDPAEAASRLAALLADVAAGTSTKSLRILLPYAKRNLVDLEFTPDMKVRAVRLTAHGRQTLDSLEAVC
jgi:hypothetical protein